MMHKKVKSVTHFLLEKLSESGDIVLEAMFPRNRVEGIMWRKIMDLPTDYEFSKPIFSSLLHRLKKEGLVVKNNQGANSKWSITQIGKNKLKYYENLIKPIKQDGIPRLVMYDIPESNRKKRYWLRSELIASGYDQLQKSVWLGYSPLSEDFIKSIKDLGLENKIHIVSINKKGTLNKF